MQNGTSTLNTGRRLGVVHDYDGLCDILRKRADALNVSRQTIDEVAGLTSGHSSKLLSAAG
jgi:hypothetical protein